MCWSRKHIYPHLMNINRRVSNSLYCICMKQPSSFMRDLRQFRNWLYRANLIVGKHHRQQTLRDFHTSFCFTYRNDTIRRYRQITDTSTILLSQFTRTQYRMMLNSRCNDRQITSCGSVYNPIVTLCSTRSKEYFFRQSPYTFRNSLSRFP